jgi:hypothetical protein
MSEAPKYVWIVEEVGDDYHGSCIEVAFTSEADADAYVAFRQGCRKTCDDCGHTHSYIKIKVPLLTQWPLPDGDQDDSETD